MTNNHINVNQEKLQEMLRKVIEVFSKDALKDPTGCGAIAGVCSSFPNCPGGESCNKET